jgi:uncharacterized membrane protein
MAKNTTPQPTTRPKEGNPYVAITAILAVFFTAVVALVVIFANSSADILAPVAFAFVLIGWIMAHYAHKQG